MGPLTALLLATPIFGFSLQAPTVSLQGSSASASELWASTSITANIAALETALDLDAADAAADGSRSRSKTRSKEEVEYLRQIKQRNKFADLHRTLGVATWVAMTATVAVGFIDYYNLYGFGAGIGSNPCVTGKAIGGDWGCDAARPAKNVLAIATTALYAGTFTLSLAMPDPDKLSEGKGEYASTLRLHKTLRWVHLSGMIAQGVLGAVMANGLFGFDRANDYKTLQALATVHMGLGMVTWGAMTWAGALMVF